MKKVITIALVALLYHLPSLKAQTKKVLLEEFTTASCGYCPPVTRNILNWHNAHSKNTIVMTIHEGSGRDAMSNSVTDSIFKAMRPTGSWFAPALMIDRGIYSSVSPDPYLKVSNSFIPGSTSAVDSIVTKLISEPAKAGVEIISSYNSATRTTVATVNVTFFEAVNSGDWRINLFLVEDSVIGTPGLGPFSGWDQKCYSTSFANTNYPGMFNGTYIIGYPHRHVMRNSLLGPWGKSGVIPSVPLVGYQYSTTTTFVVNATYKENNLSLVAFVSSYGVNKNQKYVLNANEIKMMDSFATSIDEISPISSLSVISNIYPNPVADKLTVELQKETLRQKNYFSIYNLQGQLLCQQTLQQEKTEVDISSFANGVYLIKIMSDEKSEIIKLVKE